MSATDTTTSGRYQGALRALVFCLSLTVMIGVSVWPHLLGATQAEFSHNAAMLLMMGMSSGFVYGIGFVPRLRLWRWLFSAPVALGLMLWGCFLLVR